MISKHIEIAINEAQKSTSRYRLGAVAIKNGKVVAKGYNRDDPHPFLKRRYGFYSIHAEAITVLRSRYYNADTLVVVRIKKDNSISCSYPCKKCQQVLKNSSISKVIYVDWNGNLQEISV